MTVGSAAVVVVVEAVDIAIIRAAGAVVAASVFGPAVSVVALRVSAVSVLVSAALTVTVSGAGAVVCSVAVVEDFCLPSVSDVVSGVEVVSVGVVVPELVSVGFGFSVVGSLVVCVVVPETLVPEPPEALTDDVGPSPEVVVVEPEVVPDVDVDVDGVDSVPVVVPVAPEVPEVVVPEVLPLVESTFEPVSEFDEGSD